MMGRFTANLPPSFKIIDTVQKDKTNKEGNEKSSKKRKNNEQKETHKKMIADNMLQNKQQCSEFKLNPDKKWENFAGKKVEWHAKINRKTMCPCWHTLGNCFKDCKYNESHNAYHEIPPDAKHTQLRLSTPTK
jgi:hypothetical protein